ncbi:MAG: YhgE/Pip domain-containing protein, partial [Streptococcaceae bacterium]|nr:YhgE/Pip domain-containing protein [Streptococcaceae bacterium]
AQGTQSLQDNSRQLSTGLSQLQSGSTSLQKLIVGSQNLSTGLSQLESSTSLSATQQAQISALLSGLDTVNSELQASGSASTSTITDVTTQLGEVKTSLQNLSSDQVAAVNGLSDLSLSQKAEVLAALQAASVNDMTKLTDSLTQLQTDLSSIQAGLPNQDTLNQANTILTGSHDYLSSLSSGMSSVNSAVSGHLLPGANQLSTGLTQFGAGMSTGSSQLSSGMAQFIQGVNQINTGAQTLASKSQELNTGSQKLSSGLSQLASNNGQLGMGTQQVQTATGQLTSGLGTLSTASGDLSMNLGTLSSKLTTASQQISGTNSSQINAAAISKPVNTNHSDNDKVRYNGEGMAPYMISVALFIGALSTNVVVGISFSKKKWKSGWDFMLSKVAINGSIALAQAIIVFLAVLALGLQASHAFLTLGGIILISFMYMAIVTFFVTWLGKVGDFMMLIMLVLQLATSAGTYPIQLAPKIYQIISPFLPMTYALRMIRSTIGLSGNEWGYAVSFVAITLVFVFGLTFFKNSYESLFE